MKNDLSSHHIPLLQDKIYLDISADSRSATLYFNHPEKRNAISPEMAEILAKLVAETKNKNNTHLLSELIRNGELVTLFLRSNVDGVFLSGGDLKAISTLSSKQGEIFTEQMLGFTEFLRSSSFVSIAVLNGVAAGGGSEVALACDLRVSISSNIRLELAQAKWGVPAGWGMMTDLSQKAVYGSERRRGIAIASQESWDLKKLERLGLIDAQFAADPEPELAFKSWSECLVRNLTRCPADLRLELLQRRPAQRDVALAEFDQTLFKHFWMGEEHLKRIREFASKNSQIRGKE